MGITVSSLHPGMVSIGHFFNCAHYSVILHMGMQVSTEIVGKALQTLGTAKRIVYGTVYFLAQREC